MQPQPQQVRWTGVLLASLALHGALLWVWAQQAPPPAVRTRERLQWVDVEPAPPPPLAASPSAAPTPGLPPRKKVLPRDAAAAPAAALASDAPTQAGGAQATFEGLAPRGDLPLARPLKLTPGLGTVLGLAPAADAEPPHGTTVRNGPGEEEDPVVAKEVEGERLSRSLGASLLEDVGRSAVAVGTVPGHFRHAEDALRSLFQRSKVDVSPNTVGDTVREVASVLSGGGISAQAARAVTDTPLGYSIANGSMPLANVEDSRFREGAMSLMAATEEIKRRVQEPRLKTTLELVTDPYGTVANAVVLERSGDKRFDESVLHLSRKAFRGLPDSDEKALGSSWWRTRWLFTWAPPPLPGLQADVRVKLLDAHRIPPVQ